MRKFLVFIPLAVLAIGCGAGAKSSGGGGTTSSGKPVVSENANAVTTVKAGEPLTLTEDILGSKTIAAITLTNVRYGYKAANSFDKPNKGQYVVADVAVTVNAGKFSINSASFKLVGADGTAYDSTFISSVEMLSANDLTPGQKSSGSVAFDVPKGAEKGARIALKNILADGDAGYWTL